MLPQQRELLAKCSETVDGIRHRLGPRWRLSILHALQPQRLEIGEIGESATRREEAKIERHLEFGRSLEQHASHGQVGANEASAGLAAYYSQAMRELHRQQDEGMPGRRCRDADASLRSEERRGGKTDR